MLDFRKKIYLIFISKTSQENNINVRCDSNENKLVQLLQQV